MKKIAFVPIDNRPICYSLPLDIVAQNEDIKLLLPKREFLGGLYDSSSINDIFLWLESLENVDYLILSLDTLAYGGLVTSRRCNDTKEEILERINRLEKIIKKLGAKVFAFSSIMRISNNNINEEEKEYWAQWGKKIFQYSYALHKSRRLRCANCVINTVPEDILDDYLKTRERNFEINKHYLNLAKNHVFDLLIFSKDDCAEFGLNVEEAEKLAELSKENENILIKTGADEIPLSMLTRAVADNENIKICPKFVFENSKNLISKYEDIPLIENVLAQISLAGLNVDYENPDLIFLINNFQFSQGDLVLGEANKGNLNIDFSFEKPFFIADVDNANGANINFVDALISAKNPNFMGYAGYNTSANSIGCAISCAIVYYLAKNKNENAFKKLNFIRFLDDYAYQAVIRKEVREKGEISNLFEIEPYIKDFEPYEEKFASYLGYNFKEIKYSLPWNRSFEVEIEVYD